MTNSCSNCLSPIHKHPTANKRKIISTSFKSYLFNPLSQSQKKSSPNKISKRSSTLSRFRSR